MSDLETRSIEQLPPATAVSPNALTAVQEPGGPVQKLAIRQLLGRLISTDEATEEEADLQALLDYDANSVGLVFADPTPAKNGWYRKRGAPGAGDWLQFEKLSADAASEVQALVDAAEDAKDVAVNAAANVTAINQPVAADQQRFGNSGLAPFSGTHTLTADGFVNMPGNVANQWLVPIPTDVAVGEKFAVSTFRKSGAFSGASIAQRNAAGADIGDPVPLVPIGDYTLLKTITRAAGAVSIYFIFITAADAPCTYSRPLVAKGEPARGRVDPWLLAAEGLAQAASSGHKAANLGTERFVRVDRIGGGGADPALAGDILTLTAGGTYDLIFDTGGMLAAEPFICLLPLVPAANIGLTVYATAATGGTRFNGGGTPIPAGFWSGLYRVTGTLAAAAGANPATLNVTLEAIAANVTVDLSEIYFAVSSAPPAQLSVSATTAQAISDAVGRSEARAQATAARLIAEASHGTLASGMAAGRMAMAVGRIGVFVHGGIGSDLNDGLTEATPVKTAAKAVTIAAPPGKPAIGLRDGYNYPVPPNFTTTRNLVGYGGFGFDKPATLDGRQVLSPDSWVNVGGNQWECTFAIRSNLQVPVNAPPTQWTPGTAGWQPGFDFDDEGWAYQFEAGNTVAQNNALVAAAPKRFSIVKDGSANPNVRADHPSPAGTVYRIRAHFPPGITPADGVCAVPDLWTVLNLDDADLYGIAVTGGAGKDLVRCNTDDPPPVLTNLRMTECVSHGWVGGASLAGYNYAEGRPAPGTAFNVYGQTTGYGFNFATGHTHADRDLQHDILHAKNFLAACYAHGPNAMSTSEVPLPDVIGFNSFRARHLISENCGGLFSTTPSADYAPYITEGILLDRVSALDPLTLIFGVGCDMTVKTAGGIPWRFDPRNPDSPRWLAIFNGPYTLTIEDVELDSSVALAAGQQRYLFQRDYPDTLPDPTLIIRGSRERTRQGRSMIAFPGRDVVKNKTFHKVNLVLDEAQIGCILPFGSTDWPASLIMKPGSKAGLAGLTGPQMVAALNAAGIEHDISGMTEIVDPLGRTLNKPGW